MRCSDLFALVLVLGTSEALADPPQPLYTFKLDRQPDAPPVCSMKKGAEPNADAKIAYVKVEATQGVTPMFKLDGQAIPAEPTAGLYKIPLKPGGENALEVTPLAGENRGAPCDAVRLARATEGPANPGSLDPAAYNALRSKALQAQLAELEGAREHTHFLVHLPSGQPAFPFGSAYTEGDEIQVVIVAPMDNPRTLKLEVTDCGAVNSFRTDIAVSEDGKKQAAALDNKHFLLVPVGQYFSCGSGAVTYTLTTQTTKDSSGAETLLATTKLQFRPKYHLAAIAVLGWDTARRSSFGTKTASGAMTSVIVARDEKIGSAAYLGAMWMIGGVDYEDMRAWNYFANLWLAADPSSPTKDFAVGLGLTPTGGVSIALGVTFHKGNALEGLEVGDPFSGTGDVPTRETWSGVDTGWIVGLGLDSRVYDAIIHRFSK